LAGSKRITGQEELDEGQERLRGGVAVVVEIQMTTALIHRQLREAAEAVDGTGGQGDGEKCS